MQKRKSSNADQSIDSTDLFYDLRMTSIDESKSKLQGSNEDLSSIEKQADFADGLSISQEEAIAKGNQLTGITSDDEHKIIRKADDTKPSETGLDSRNSDSGTDKGNAAITISQVGDASMACVVVDTAKFSSRSRDSSSHDSAPADKPSDLATDADDHSTWETVEAKSRGNRNKKAATGQIGSGKFASLHPPNAVSVTGSGALSATKKNKKPTATRRRYANPNRKMVREILASVLDGVDAEVKRRRSQAVKSVADGTKRLSDRSNHIIHSHRPAQKCNGPSQIQAWQARPMTMRDVVLGRLRVDADKVVVDDSTTMKRPATTAHGQAKTGPTGGSGNVSAGGVWKKDASTGDKAPVPPSRGYPNLAWADQSTALTVPETLSGISANTQSSANTDGDNGSENYDISPEKAVEHTDAGDSSSGDEAVFASTRQQAKAKGDMKDSSPEPPLPALLGPGNTNSTSSSVASSLEAPHARHIHHHCSTANENDVGYHLLDVCDRLSRDMDIFMRRRSLALVIRRRERGALLAALQDTASVSVFVGL